MSSMSSTFKAREEIKEEGNTRIVIKSINQGPNPGGVLTRLSSIDSLGDKSTDNNTTAMMMQHSKNNSEQQ